MNFAPKPLKGLVNGNGNDNGARQRRTATHAESARTQAADSTQAGRRTAAKRTATALRTAAQASGEGSPMDAHNQRDGSPTAMDASGSIMERMSLVADDESGGRGKC